MAGIVTVMALLLICASLATGTTTTLQVALLPPRRVPQRLLAFNDMFVNPATYTNNSASPPRRKHWVPATVASPFEAPALATAVRALRTGALRYPGGTVANVWNLTSAALVANSTICARAPHSCNRYAWMRRQEADWPQGALGPTAWAQLTAAADVHTSWVLSPLLAAGSSSAAADQVAHLRTLLHPDETLHTELGNELYDQNSYAPPVDSAAAYLALSAPALSAVGSVGNATAAVIACPCDMFYNGSCWGAGFYQSWNGNLSALRAAHCGNAAAPSPQAVAPFPQAVNLGAARTPPRAGTPAHSRASKNEALCFASVTAHNYALDLSALSGLRDNATRLLAMTAASEMTLSSAAERMQEHFPGLLLHITEFNVFWPDVWDGKGGDTDAAHFMAERALSGAHGIFVASAFLAALRHADVIGSLHYHGFLQPCGPQGCDRTCSQPGFAIVSLDTADMLQVSPTGQIFAHVAAVARSALTAVPLNLDANAPVVLELAGRSGVAPAQGALFNRGDMQTLVIVLRLDTAAVHLPLPLPGLKQANSTFYAAGDLGSARGWSAYSLDAVESMTLPWPGPLTTRADCASAAGGEGLTIVTLGCGVGLYFVDLVSQ